MKLGFCTRCEAYISFIASSQLTATCAKKVKSTMDYCSRFLFVAHSVTVRTPQCFIFATKERLFPPLCEFIFDAIACDFCILGAPWSTPKLHFSKAFTNERKTVKILKIYLETRARTSTFSLFPANLYL